MRGVTVNLTSKKGSGMNKLNTYIVIFNNSESLVYKTDCLKNLIIYILSYEGCYGKLEEKCIKSFDDNDIGLIDFYTHFGDRILESIYIAEDVVYDALLSKSN